MRSLAPKHVPQLTQRALHLGEVSFNPFLLALRLGESRLVDSNGETTLKFRALLVDANAFGLVRGQVAFDAIALDGPEVILGLKADGTLSIADMLEGAGDAKKAPKSEEEKGAGPVVRIDSLVVSQGALSFVDATREPAYRARLEPFGLTLSNFSTEPGASSPYDFVARLGQSTLSWKGSFSAAPLSSKGRVALEHVDLTAFGPYLKGVTEFIVARGTASVASAYELDSSNGPLRLSVSDAALTVADVSVRGPVEATEALGFSELLVKVPSFDLLNQRGRVESAVVKGLRVAVTRVPGGGIDLAQWATVAQKQAPKAFVADAGHSTPSALQVDVGRVALEGARVAFADTSLRTPVQVPLDNIALEVKGLSFPAKEPVQVDVKLDRPPRGLLAATATLAPDFVTVALKVALSDWDLASSSPYVSEWLFASIAQGTLSTTASVHHSPDSGTHLEGSLVVADLSVLDDNARTLLSGKRLALDGIDLHTSPPFRVTTKKVALEGVQARLDIDADGRLALSKLARDVDAGAPEVDVESESGPAKSYAVDLLELRGLGVNLNDSSVTPPLRTVVSGLTGSVRAARWPATKPAVLALKGRVDTASLAVSGTVRPSGKDSAVDLTLKLDGYDLPATSGDTVRYVAQPVQTGRLSLDLGYRVQGRKLEGQNKVVVQRLVFGERVAEPGPDATSLPLGLAAAILSDRNGRIEVDVPVTGDLDAPDFHYGSVVWGALKNVLVKVATAPFNLLASLVGGDPEALKSLSFEPGTTELSADSMTKVPQLARLLEERPALGFELVGATSPDTDGQVVRRERLARSEGLLPRDGGLDSEAYARAVRALWTRAALKNAADAGPLPEPSFAEAERTVLASITLESGTFDELARARVAAAHDVLVDAGVAATRLFAAASLESPPAAAPAVYVNVK